MLAEIKREIERAEKMELKIRAARYNKVREILSRCDEQDILLLRRILKAGGAVPKGNDAHADQDESDSTAADSQVVTQTDARFRGLPETTLRGPLGPVTQRGSPRERAWGVLVPAVEQALDEVKEITSLSIYEYLTERQYPFSTTRPVHSIAAVLRKMTKRGNLIQVTHGKGQKPVLFRKRERRLVSMA